MPIIYTNEKSGDVELFYGLIVCNLCESAIEYSIQLPVLVVSHVGANLPVLVVSHVGANLYSPWSIEWCML